MDEKMVVGVVILLMAVIAVAFMVWYSFRTDRETDVEISLYKATKELIRDNTLNECSQIDERILLAKKNTQKNLMELLDILGEDLE